MKLHIMSDLHLEFGPMTPAETQADVVVLAGDIHLGTKGIEWAAKHFRQPVIYVPGNHEFYDEVWTLSELLTQMRERAKGTNVHLLDRDEIVIDGVRFLGTTLWTDLLDNPIGGNCCGLLSNDANCITVDTGDPFTVLDAQMLFETNRSWLRGRLKTPFQGKTVVVTHHAPSPSSIHPRYACHPLTPCFVTNVEELMGPCVDVWVHGHTHSGFDYEVKGTRVICNPRGYPDEVGWEHTGFEPEKIVEI